MGKKLTQEQFIEKCKIVHKDTYDLSKVVYISMHIKVEIICKIHGSFLIAPNHFLKGTMCSFCNKERLRNLRTKDLQSFVNKANEIHNSIYNYDCSEYVSNHIKLKIQCSMHGIFEQTPANHLSGHGCLLCTKLKKSKKECDLADWLKSYTTVDQNYKPKWLGKKEIDIYLPEYHLGIEFNGTVYHHSTRDTTPYYQRYFKEPTYHESKYNLCAENNIQLLHIFEFEDLDIWKDMLFLFFKSPKDFKITFSNSRREYIHNNVPLDFYGISKILRGDL